MTLYNPLTLNKYQWLPFSTDYSLRESYRILIHPLSWSIGRGYYKLRIFPPCIGIAFVFYGFFLALPWFPLQISFAWHCVGVWFWYWIWGFSEILCVWMVGWWFCVYIALLIDVVFVGVLSGGWINVSTFYHFRS